jgi:glycosyltransferase involved in cell wall biosynthesis
LPESFTAEAGRRVAWQAMQKAAGPVGDYRPPFTVLMLCSLKGYKGILPFIACAKELPDLLFELVLNAPRREIDDYFKTQTLPANLRLYDRQSDTHRFYSAASVVVNFSLPDEWIETFGMTVLEAMYYKKPVIVPPVGGPVELVTNGVNGFCLDSRHVEPLVTALRLLSANEPLYSRMSQQAWQRALFFTQDRFRTAIIQIILESADLPNNIFSAKNTRYANKP